MREKRAQYIHVVDQNRDQLVGILEKLIARKKDHRLESVLSRIHSADLAQLWHFFDETEQGYILDFLDEEDSAEFLSELDPQVRAELIKSKNISWVAERLLELDPDDSADILRDLSQWEVDNILRKFDNSYSRKIKELLKYPDETAGSLMTSDFFAVLDTASVETIIRQFRAAAKVQEIEDIHFIYVVDKKNRLLGYLPIRKLLLEDPDRKAHELMKPPQVRVHPEMDQEDVAKIFRTYDLISIPVVSADESVLLGRITIDDIVDVFEEEASEDVYHMVGLHKGESFSNGIFISLKHRLPWMLINIFTTSLSAIIIGLYRGVIEQFVLIAMFMPMVAAIGGATGNQMVAVVVRGLATGRLFWEQVRWVLFRDTISVVLGSLVVGILIGSVSYFIFDQFTLGFVISLALLLNMVFATVIGAAIPFLLKLTGSDPAYGSSILVAASTDMMGFFIFLWLASEIIL